MLRFAFHLLTYNKSAARWLIVQVMVIGLAACGMTLNEPPPQFGFYSSSQPWQLIPAVAEDYRGEMMWVGVDEGGGAAVVVTPDSLGRFSIWVYNDPPAEDLAIHLAVPSAGEENVSYGVGALLEPVDTSLTVYRKMRKVKEFVFQVSPETYRLINEEQDPSLCGRLVINSPQLGLAFIALGDCPLAQQARKTPKPLAQPEDEIDVIPRVERRSGSAADRPDAPLAETRNTAGMLEFAYPVVPYGPGTYGGRGFGAENKAAGLPPFHLGEDVLLEPGTPVRAVAEGRVVLSSEADGYGWVVVMEHELRDGTLLNTIYGHLSTRENFKPVESGKYLDRGQLLGYVGWDDRYPHGDSAENGDGGPHLHMGLRVVGTKRDYEPGVRGSWYRGYGTAEDMGLLNVDGEHTGGAYLAFSQFMRHGYRELTTVVKSDLPADVNLE